MAMLSSQIIDNVKNFKFNPRVLLRLDRTKIKQIAGLSSNHLKMLMVISVAVMLISIFFAVKTTSSMVEMKMMQSKVDAQAYQMPKITYTPVPGEDLRNLATRLNPRYPGISFQVVSETDFIIGASEFKNYEKWVEAINTVKSSDPNLNWRWQMKSLCIGKGCTMMFYITMNPVKIAIQPPDPVENQFGFTK